MNKQEQEIKILLEYLINNSDPAKYNPVQYKKGQFIIEECFGSYLKTGEYHKSLIIDFRKRIINNEYYKICNHKSDRKYQLNKRKLPWNVLFTTQERIEYLVKELAYKKELEEIERKKFQAIEDHKTKLLNEILEK